jgi:hypothetical protein
VKLVDPENLLLLSSEAGVTDRWVEPLRELSEERHEVCDGTGRRDLRNEQVSVVRNGNGGVGLSVGEASSDSGAVAVAVCIVILGLSQQLGHHALHLVGGVAVVASVV